MSRFWKIRKSEYLLRSKWMSLRTDTCVTPAGHKVDSYYVIERPDCVGIVAVTADRKLLLLRQYRHPVQDFVLEFPAGHIEHGKSPAEAAAEELRQETGYAHQRLVPLGTLLSDPSRQTLKVHLFLALGCEPAGPQLLDPTEQIEVSTIPFAKAEQLIRDGTLRDGLAVASYHLAKDWLRRNAR